jgi:hypothetical protein
MAETRTFAATEAKRAEMTTEPTQLAGALRCGAKTRGARGGRPCRSPAMANGRCRMHGGRSGGPTGSRNGAWRGGKYSQEAKAVSKWAREMARGGEALLAETLDSLGMGRKLPASLRRRAHIKKARAAAKARKQGKTE